ncbi:uncharacterized protein LOC136092757 [Hydra vulgaris]|uniref:uncharacterized protein LOC136092757 n=1 Tax=Hydra vulgaris TaxID=6087 RepID=UPI0032EA639B
MERTDLKTGETITTIATFSTKAEVVLESADLNEFYERATNKILESLSAFQQSRSSWRFVSVEKMDINIIEYSPINARSYIPHNKELANKKAIINIKNEDNECFNWCVARFFNTKENNSERVDKDLKKQAEKLNWEKIEFPVSLNQITQFEKNNQDISVNVFGYKSSIKYRGAAHNDCNLNYKIPKFIPVFFHSLTGYDSHQFIKKLSEKEYSDGEINFIPNNEEKKGVYLYKWVDSFSKLNETQLPPKELFFSRLNDERISDENNLHAQTVWNEFNCKTFIDYHNLCNVADVLLLAHAFENFRDLCMKNYKLDPAWYYTSPGLAWDAALKITKIKLELLSDYDMILMLKHGVRGGISMISNRLGTDNNKYMETYDKSKESKYIQYLDANNLYEWAMKVDLEYPEHLHDAHNNYSLAPERSKIDKVEKLIPNLNHKKNVIHYENLKLYERLRLNLTKIHKGIKFKESAWLSEYIKLNTDLRKEAKNDFEKEFFKLMNNSVFGKTMENIENRVDVRLVTKKEEAIKLASKPKYESKTIFDESLIAIHMKRTKLLYNKPIFLGMCILDMSKTLVYKFHYDYIKSKYGDRAKLLFTDADSLAFEIKTKDFYSDIKNDLESKFNTSEFEKNHPATQNRFKVGLNKKELGKFKYELAGKQIKEFIGLRSKLYSYKLQEKDIVPITDEKYKNPKKGVKKIVVEKYITHEDYKDCLLSRRDQIRKMYVIRSHCHDVYTEEINKIALK